MTLKTGVIMMNFFNDEIRNFNLQQYFTKLFFFCIFDPINAALMSLIFLIPNLNGTVNAKFCLEALDCTG